MRRGWPQWPGRCDPPPSGRSSRVTEVSTIAQAQPPDGLGCSGLVGVRHQGGAVHGAVGAVPGADVSLTMKVAVRPPALGLVGAMRALATVCRSRSPISPLTSRKAWPSGQARRIKLGRRGHMGTPPARAGRQHRKTTNRSIARVCGASKRGARPGKGLSADGADERKWGKALSTDDTDGHRLNRGNALRADTRCCGRVSDPPLDRL